jgi:hypothetical protein
MKIKLFPKRVLGTAITVLCLIGIASPFSSRAQTQSTPLPSNNSAESGALPSNIPPTSPLAQVVRLAQAGVDESVIMTYVTNSGSMFNLNPDEIIYLKDIGLPNEVVTAMMHRDQQLQQPMTASVYQPPTQPVPEMTDQPETASVSQPVEQPAEVTVNYFYDTLTPYGNWVDVDGYGRCWRPSVEVYNSGWQPYSDHGHWVYTDRGWYWSSDYSWGWAPFHYGRWFRDSHQGWCWSPDTVWGPSWVTWRYSDDYCGWAPLPPRAVYREGVGFFYNGLAVSVGFDFGLSWNCFAFVPIGHFCDPHPHRYRMAPAQVTQIYNRTTVINDFNVRDHNFVNRGIGPERITAVTRTPIHEVEIHETTTRVPHGEQFSRDNRTLTINRPNFAGAPVEPLHQGIVPRPLPGTPNPSQNNFQRQPLNQNPHPVPNVSAPQTRLPEIPRVTVNGPQNHNTVPPVVPPVHNPQVGAPVQTPPPHNYNSDNRPSVSPKMQGQQTSRGIISNPSERGNTITEERSIGSPAVNHYSPPVVPVTHAQNNYDAPRNTSHYNDARSNQSQSSQTSNRQDQDQDKRGH